MRNCLLVFPSIKMCSSNSEHQGRKQSFRTQETDASVVFVSILVQYDQCRGPFNLELEGKRSLLDWIRKGIILR